MERTKWTENGKKLTDRTKRCKWCGKEFVPKKHEMFCSVECVKKDKELYEQRKICLTCKYSSRLWNNLALDVICGYLLKTGQRRNCDINPCDKYERGV